MGRVPVLRERVLVAGKERWCQGKECRVSGKGSSGRERVLGSGQGFHG